MDKDVLRIVRGNDFTTRMRITAVDAAGKEVEGFSLDDSTGVEVYYTVGSQTVPIDEWTASGADITIDWSGLGLGGYGFEISGVLDGSAWRMAVRLLFRIVATNNCANVPAGTLVDGVYVLDNWLYLLSGGSGGAKDAVLYTEQTLTDEQKAQARENIGVPSLLRMSVGSGGVVTFADAGGEAVANADAARWMKDGVKVEFLDNGEDFFLTLGKIYDGLWELHCVFEDVKNYTVRLYLEGDVFYLDEGTGVEFQPVIRNLSDIISGARKGSTSVQYVAQTLDGGKQQQARQNIGAARIPFVFEPFVAPGLIDSDIDGYLAEGRALQLSVDGNLVDYSQWAGGYLVWVVDDIETVSPYTRTTRVYRLNVDDDVWSVLEANYPSTEGVGDVNQIKAAVEAIEAVIPAAATAQNQLADKAFVNSSINSSTANFVGTFNSLAELQAVTGATNNDYGFVIETDAQGNQYYDRYKYNGSAWLFEYKVESTPFTAAQWAAIQSGMTAALVAKLSALPTNAELTAALDGKQDVISDLSTIRSGAAAGATAVQPAAMNTALAGKQDTLTFDSTPTASSSNPVTSGGVKSSLDTKADKSDTYTKAEIGNLITPIDSEVIVGALPATGVANKVYRVPGTDSYTDWAWDGSTFVKLATYNGDYDAVDDIVERMEVIDSDAYMSATTDDEGKVVEDITAGGVKEFHIPTRVDDALAVEKGADVGGDVNVGGNATINGVEFSNSDSPEWVDVKTDADGRIIEGTRPDGTKVIPYLEFGELPTLRSRLDMLESYHPIYPHGAIVAFVDDDTGRYVPEIWDDIIADTGIRLGFACITGFMAGIPTTATWEQMTLEQLRGYYDAGHEVYSHSWTHPSFRTSTPEVVDEQCRKSRDWLLANGFLRNADVIVYPGGMGVNSTTPAKHEAVRRNYRFGVDTTTDDEGLNPEPLDELCICRFNVDNHTLAQCTARVDAAIEQGKLLVFISHAYELMGYGATSLSPSKDVNVQRVKDLIHYIQDRNVPIIPLEEAIHQIYGW